MSDYNSLAEIKIGQSAIIDHLENKGSMCRRLLDLGFVHGTKIKCLQKNPTGDTIAYMVRGSVIALRKDDAVNIKAAEIFYEGGEDK